MVTNINNIAIFTEMLISLVAQRKKVLLVCDIDDTLITPVVDLGSDAWFRYSLKHEKIDAVVDKLSMIYGIVEFRGVETDTDRLIETIKELSDAYPMKYISLTARDVLFHSFTL